MPIDIIAKILGHTNTNMTDTALCEDLRGEHQPRDAPHRQGPDGIAGIVDDHDETLKSLFIFYGSKRLFLIYRDFLIHPAMMSKGCVCLLLKFYIKPQRSAGCPLRSCSCILLKFYIKPQLCTVLDWRRESCILLKFYIKPQLYLFLVVRPVCCILLKFYIKPQLRSGSPKIDLRCILLKFYIKPQLDVCFFD